MEKVFIYMLVDPRNQQVRYIGKAKEPQKRFQRGHRYEKQNTRKCNWVQSLLKQGLTPLVQIIDEVLFSEWQFWEMHYISLYKSWGFDLTNHTGGGDQPPLVRKFGENNSFRLPKVQEKILAMNYARKGKTYLELYGEMKALELINNKRINMSGDQNPNFGKPRTEDVKIKIGRANSGVNNGMYGVEKSKEWKEAMSKVHKAKIVSELTKKKMSKAKKGKKQSKVVTEKIKNTKRKNHSGFKGKVFQYTKDFQLVQVWNNLKEIQQMFSTTNICSCLTGKLKSAYGFIWTRTELSKL